METKYLSSAQTFVMKFVFPAIWIAGFGAGTLALWSEAIRAGQGVQTPPELKWVFLFAWMAGTTFIGWICFRLKRIRLDGAILHVSNFRQEIAVPLTAIDGVSENRWINIRPVTVHFNRTTAFGDSIVFMPKARLFALWSPHPAVAQLEQAAMTARLREAGH